MNHPTASEPPERGNFAISILRVILWLLPAAVLVGGFFLAFNMDEKWPILLVPGVAIFAGLGYFDRRLYLQQRKLDASAYRKETATWTIAFILLQIIIAPTIAFGGCMVVVSGF